MTKDLYDVLEELSISYQEIEHPPIFTVEDASHIEINLDGIGCKNLFLTDKKDKFFLYVLPDEKRADLKSLKKFLEVSHLTFAKDIDLFQLLHLTPGSVTPLGIMHDIENKVVLLLDKELEGKTILIHSNTNTKTICISYLDLLRFIDYFHHSYFLIN